MTSGRNTQLGARGKWVLPVLRVRLIPVLQLWLAIVLPALTALLGGCSSLPNSINPVAWWHDLEGGAIAAQRPPPPGATDPFPNLSTVPDKPAPSSPAARQQIAQALVADRTNAQHAAEAAPLPDPSSQAASPELFGRGSAPPPPPAGTATASLEAANAPPAASPPVEASEATPLPPQAAPAFKPGSRAATTAAPAASSTQTDAIGTTPLAPPGAAGALAPPRDSGAAPALPGAPPPSPDLPGAPAAQVRPAAPRAPSAAAAGAPRHAPSVEPVAVAFAGGSAVLSNAGSASLRQLAAKRGSARVAVTGFGEAAARDPDAQSAALTLGLQRANAMATALTQAGVPASSVRIDAEASGRGGAARLVD